MSRSGDGELDGVPTPWGTVAELRARRLPPGRRPRGATPARRHQSERIFGALVALASKQGYANTSLRDLQHASGVIQASFYKYFHDKDECFLAAIEEIYGDGVRAVAKGCAGEPDPERRVRAALAGLMELIAEQPAAALVCVVNVYEAGEAGVRLAERELTGFGRLLAAELAGPSAGAVPDVIARALVAGVQMTIHNHLQRGEAGKLPALGPALADWLLSYAPPPAALPIPPTPPSPAPTPPPGETDIDERLLRAVAAICARDGVRRLTAQAIVDEARMSLATLYGRFPGGPEKAFLHAFETIVGRCVEVSAAAYGASGDWPTRMEAVNRDLFSFLASEPAWAKTVLVEVLGAGAEALTARDRVLTPFGDFVEGGQELAPKKVPQVVREAIVFAVYSLVGHEIAERGTAGVPGLVPLAGFIEFAPYLGAGAAAATVRRLAEEERAAPGPEATPVEVRGKG